MKINRLCALPVGLRFAGAAALSSPAMCADNDEHFKFYDESSYTPQ
jgi:hypothetical protein